MRNELDRLKKLRDAGHAAFLEVPLGSVAFREEGDAVRSEIQLFVDGERVHPFWGAFKFDAKFRKALSEEFAKGNPRPIDVNHASMMAFDYEGGKAYGWIEQLHDRGKEGLFATVRWTEAGVKAVRSGEYAFISPEFSMDHVDRHTGEKTGRPKLFAAALTNRPFLEGMEAVAAAEPLANHQPEVPMDPKDKKGPEGGADGGNVVDLSERVRALEAENQKLKAREEVAAASLKAVEDGKKTEIIRHFQSKEGGFRVVPANLPAIEKLAALSTPDELKAYLSGLPTQLHAEQPAAGAAQPGPGKETQAATFSEDDRAMLESLGFSEEAVRKYGDVKAVRADGRAVLTNGKVVKLSDLNGGRA